jgi:hypothetical protein
MFRYPTGTDWLSLFVGAVASVVVSSPSCLYVDVVVGWVVEVTVVVVVVVAVWVMTRFRTTSRGVVMTVGLTVVVKYWRTRTDKGVEGCEVS